MASSQPDSPSDSEPEAIPESNARDAKPPEFLKQHLFPIWD
jgi:hypothetical protein